MSGVRRVAVIGGGVSGLATAYRLMTSPAAAAGELEVTLLEAESRLGGKVASQSVGGIEVDTGPDALMMRSPAAARLVADLGLDDRLRAPSGAGAYLWSRGRLRPLPTGSVFGVPDRLWPLLRSGVLGPVGFVRAGADLILPRHELRGDPSVEQVLRPRLGRQVFERLVEPMLGGVHAGRAGRLSARSAAAEVLALAQGQRSLYLALRRRRTNPPAPGASATGASVAGASATPPRPALMSLEGGLTTLVEALAAAVTGAGAVVRTGVTVRELRRADEGYLLLGDGFGQLVVDDVVLATPAGAAGRLLRPTAPAAADALEAIPYAGVATVIMAFRPSDLPAELRGTGFLVPPVEGRLLVGCSWLTAKWPHLAGTAASAPVLIRGMVGRDGDQAWAGLDDAALASAVRDELAAAMGVRGEPFAVHVRRMPAAMPQYTVGHAARLAAAEAALAGLPGIRLTGAGYRGVGLAACIAQAGDAAAAVLDRSAEELSTR